MKFRQHRGGLAESMETVVELPATAQAIADHLAGTYWPHVYAGNITVQPYGFDLRIGWDSHLVMDGPHPVGWTDGPLDT